MFELIFVEGTDECPSYYKIHRNGELWSMIGYETVWQAISEIRIVDSKEAKRLEDLEYSVQ